MPRPLNDSPYLYGLHDPGGEAVMADQKVFGWVLFTEELGADPNDPRGGDYSRWADQGFGILVRLNHGYEPNGTLPASARYGDFARRCANFARNSRGANIWIIGNEMNYAVERPGVRFDWNQNPPALLSPGEVILPGNYANCYRQCRQAIRAVGGHENDQVIVGAPAPWNTQTAYEGNTTGDWVKYLTDVLTLLAPTPQEPVRCDGISIHAYTHGADPNQIYNDYPMNPPFQNRQYNFRTYRDFMEGIPRSLRSLPVYLTEADQNDEWRNENNGWVQRAYGEIDAWNKVSGNQKIRALILYRWPRGLDKWGIEGKQGVIEDFRAAIGFKYRWDDKASVTPITPVTPVTPVTPTPPVVADTSPISFPQTGRTAKGIFAAYYRQFGLDLTGFPMTEEFINPDSGLKSQDWQRVLMEEYPPGKVQLRLAGEQLRELRGKLTRVEQQILQLQRGGGAAAEPAISDISAQLPRKPEGLFQRPLDAIQHIVINHTGVRPEVGADRVAAAQIARWPAIVGQYFITGEGQIQQTNPPETVVAKDQAWIYNGINIYVAGNFDDAVPSTAQLAALAQLCSWLLGKYSLSEDAVKGVSEFIVTRSPGAQWLSGQRWKDQLLAQVRAIPVVSPSTPTGADTAGLRAKIEALQNQALDLQAQLTDTEGQNTRLQARVSELESGIGNVVGTGGVARPAMTDITLQLPRDAASLKARPTDQIKYLVFNHTAVDASVGVERVAASHQKRWGAILYQFFIAGDGSILQTNPLDQVVDLGQNWIAQGLNIAVAGNFTAEAPTDAQISAAARLSAWLMAQYKIPAESVKGVSEFINSQSPGQQWLAGKNWKGTLLARIADVQKAAGPSSTGGDSMVLTALRAQLSQLQFALTQAQSNLKAVTEERDRLRDQGSKPSQTDTQLSQQLQAITKQSQTLAAEKVALSQQVQTLSSEKSTLGQQVQALTNEKAALTQQMALSGQDKLTLAKQISDLQIRIRQLESGPSTPPPVSPPVMQDVVDDLVKHPTLKYATRTLNKISHITVHHSAAPANVTPDRVAAYHVNNVGWPGIGYHFYVEPDGIIFQVNRLETIAYHVGNSNSYSIGICVSGTFTGVAPTPNQIEQAGHLIAWLVQKLNLKLENVMGHKEFPENITECPGDDWLAGKQWKQMLFARVNNVLAGRMTSAAKTLGHYVLFWQRQDAWAREDFAAAGPYIARFRPTAGFSADDARSAEYVTIVGGVAGVPYEAEQGLIAAGCKVERLAGANFDETKKLLDDLTQSGRRFKTFNV